MYDVNLYIIIIVTQRDGFRKVNTVTVNPLNAELNPICHVQALLGAHHILHVSRIRVNSRVPHVGTVHHSLTEVTAT